MALVFGLRHVSTILCSGALFGHVNPVKNRRHLARQFAICNKRLTALFDLSDDFRPYEL